MDNEPSLRIPGFGLWGPGSTIRGQGRWGFSLPNIGRAKTLELRT
jgi:hypothetical protein